MGVKINSTAGCAGLGDKEEEREGFATECVDRIIYLHLFYQ
jgi:hypothetical protein